MSGIKFVHVPMDKYYEFIKGAAESEDIVECVTYLNMKENRIYTLAREGKTAQQVADALGVSKSAIDKSEGWKNRKNDEFVF